MEQHGLVAHIRVLVALVDDEWKPICGRIDVARPDDAPTVAVRPKTSVRLLLETVGLAELAARLHAAFKKQPFVVQGESIAGHGMDTQWSGERHPEDWPLYGTQWPVFMFCPTQGVALPVLMWEAIEADGELEAIDGTENCVRLTMGFIERSRGGGDVRFNRFQVVIWDYRGVIRSKVKDGSLRIEVSPPKSKDLTLAVITGDKTGTRARRRAAPKRLKIPVTGALRRVNMTLRSGAETVCQVTLDRATEEWGMRVDGRTMRSPSAPEIIEAEPVSTVSKLVLGFMADPLLGPMVVRDLGEIDSAIKASAHKAALLLIGSVLEASLLDVASRNEHVARLHFGSRWSDKVSPKELIAFLAGTRVQTSTTTAPLITPMTSKKSVVVVDHRDLIHPRAEVRGAATPDEPMVASAHGILREVIRDLRKAHEDGLIDAYASGSIIP
jgi:hypothetical protein